MSNSIRLVVVTLALSSGCTAPYLLRPGDLPPRVIQLDPATRVALWHRAIDVLLDEGYVPQVLNEAACFISAKQRDDVQVGQLAGTTALVTISPEGRLRLEVGGVGIYHSQSELQRDVSATEDRVIREIVGPTQSSHVKPVSANALTRDDNSKNPGYE